MKQKRYSRDSGYSYTLGMTLTIEMIKYRKSSIRNIYVHPYYIAKDSTCNIFDICRKEHIPCEISQKIFNCLSAKGNVFVIGVFEKFDAAIDRQEPHILLVNPSDSGNLGTIIRTGLGFGFRDYAIIRPGVDIYDPKTIRATMGAFFHIRFSYYDSFACYRQKFPEHEIYSFMLDGEIDLREVKERPAHPFSLVFGNEAAGLSDSFHGYGKTIRIAHNREIDSLNLAVAFGLAANAFASKI